MQALPVELCAAIDEMEDGGVAVQYDEALRIAFSRTEDSFLRWAEASPLQHSLVRCSGGSSRCRSIPCAVLPVASIRLACFLFHSYECRAGRCG